MDYICSKCGKKAPTTTRQAKCDCGGLWNLDYVPPKFSLEDVDCDEWSMFRYRKFMAVEGDGWKDISLGEGMTPVVRFDENVPEKVAINEAVELAKKYGADASAGFINGVLAKLVRE